MFDFLKKLGRRNTPPDYDAIAASALAITSPGQIGASARTLDEHGVAIVDAVARWLQGKAPSPASYAAAIWLAPRAEETGFPQIDEHLTAALSLTLISPSPTTQELMPAAMDAAMRLSAPRRDRIAADSFANAGRSDQRFRLLKLSRGDALLALVADSLDDLPERQIAVVSAAFRTSFGPHDVDALLAHYRPESPGAEAFIAAFGSVGDARFVSLLTERLDDPRDRIADAALRALAKIQAVAEPAVLEALQASRKAVRLAAAEILNRWELNANIAAAVRTALDGEKVAEVRDLMTKLVPMSGELNLKSLSGLRNKVPEDVATRIRAAIRQRLDGQSVDFGALDAGHDELLAVTAHELQGAPGGADRCMAVLDEVLSAASDARLGPWASAWFLRSIKPLYSQGRPLPWDVWAASHGRYGEAGLGPLVELLLDHDVELNSRLVEWLFAQYSPHASHARLLTHPDHELRKEVIAAMQRHASRQTVELVAPMLDDSRQDVRTSAAEALGQVGGEAAEIALRARLTKERARGPRRAIEAALTQLTLAEVASGGTLATLEPNAENHARLDARFAAIGAKPKYDVTTLPELRWSSGAAMSDGARRWLIAMLEQCDYEVPDPELEAIRHHLNDVDAKRWLTALQAGFDAEHREVRIGWVLFATVVLANEDQIAAIGTGLDKMARSGLSEQAFRRVEVLERAATHGAIGWLDHWYRKAKSAGLRSRAGDAMGRIATRRGVSREELADLVFGDFGLDARGERQFEVGDRTVIARFDTTGEVGVVKPDGSLTTRFPSQHAADDPTDYERVRDSYRAWRKALKRALSGQIDRLEWSMIWGRTWSIERFLEVYGTHPVLGALARGILWSIWDGTQHHVTRFGRDQSFSTVNDEPFEGPIAAISVAHPVHLAPGDGARWQEVFVDYLLVSPFPQFDRPRRSVDAVGTSMSFTDVDGEALRRRLLDAGWQRGEAEDGGAFYEFARSHPNGIDAVAAIDPGLYVASEPGSSAQDVIVEFWRARERIDLVDVPRCMLAEVAVEVAGPD